MSGRVPVASAAEFEPGAREIVETEHGEIGVFNVDGEYYALKNECPHRRGPVCTGKVSGAIVGEWTGTGERVDEQFGDPAVTCPWHGWDFYLETGTHVGDDTFSVPAYDVVVEDGTVFLDL